MMITNSPIYLDNAATSFPKPECVISSTLDCIRHYCGNPGRSGHSLSITCAERVYECRELIARLLSYPFPERISFTHNATAALNIAIKGLVPSYSHCIITDLEHNSVIRPLIKLVSERMCRYDVFDSSLPLTRITELICPETKYIISTLQSNVTGKQIDIKILSDIAYSHNLGLIIDASQYVGHYPLLLEGLHFDAVCMPGHKALFGIQGCGALVLGEKRCDTLLEGGSGSDSFNTEMPLLPPERYEAGTLPTPSIVSLLCGVQFIMDYGIYNIQKRIDKLTERLKDLLLNIPSVHLYACENGIAAFKINKMPSEILAEMLDKYGICLRGGIHCAPLIHKKMMTEQEGLVRASLSILNKEWELDRLYSILKSI